MIYFEKTSRYYRCWPDYSNRIGKDEFWGNLIAGKSGIGLITQFDASDPGFTTKIAGEVKDFDFANYGDKKEGKRMDRVTQFAVAAAKLAVEDAELDLEKIDPFVPAFALAAALAASIPSSSSL